MFEICLLVRDVVDLDFGQRGQFVAETVHPVLHSGSIQEDFQPFGEGGCVSSWEKGRRREELKPRRIIIGAGG